MNSKIRIFKGNKLLGIEEIPQGSRSEDRLKYLKTKRYRRYTRYILDKRIEIRRGFEERIAKGKDISKSKWLIPRK